MPAGGAGPALKPLKAKAMSVADKSAGDFLSLGGFSAIEEVGRWSDGAEASLGFVLPRSVSPYFLVMLEFAAFTRPGLIEEQSVEVTLDGALAARWQAQDPFARMRGILIKNDGGGGPRPVQIGFGLPQCARPADLGLGPDRRQLGIALSRVMWRDMPGVPKPEDWLSQLGRPVGGEARKTFDQRVLSGFWQRFMLGQRVLDIGFKGYSEVKGVVPIAPSAIGLDLDYPGYDGRTLPFSDDSQDCVYSSHCLEHIADYKQAIREWHRVTRVGGHIITAVPHAWLYERGMAPPSRWNEDHKRFYTPASLLGEFEEALAPNSYRVRFLEDNDKGYRYGSGPETHPYGCYEIVLVIEKIAPPAWGLSD